MTTYLDCNATAPLKPEVVAAMHEALQLPLNASSAHVYGRKAKAYVEDTRRLLAERINCWPQEIIWTASASESNNTILAQYKNIWVSAIEHSSIKNAASGDVQIIPVTHEGVIDLEWLKVRLEAGDKPEIISVMAANNETGVIQPIRKLVKLAAKHGVKVHTDAVQMFGKMPMDFTALGVDYMTLGFHKCGAPQGLGALVVANGRPFRPFIKGGGQEFNRRASTENIAALAGLQAWLKLADDFEHYAKLRAWLDEMEATLTPPPLGGMLGRGRNMGQFLSSVQECPHPGLLPEGEGNLIAGASSPRMPNTSCIILPKQGQEITLMQADLAGICISAGSACSSGRIEPSHVLSAMGYSRDEAGRAVRISGGWETTKEDIDKITLFLNKIL